MATVRKRGNGWSVQVRRKGYEAQTRTFRTKRDADAWAREQEGRIDRSETPADRRTLRGVTLRQLLERYMAEVTPRKRSADTELLRLSKLLRHSIAEVSLADLTPAALAAYRDDRLRSVKPGTVRRELSLIGHAIDTGRREWGLILQANPLKLVSKPTVRDARDRRLRRGELARLEEALEATRNPLVGPIIRFAIDTALRRAELLGLEWRNVDLTSRTAHIPWSKTGKGRTIPLTDGAVAILLERGVSGTQGRVFPTTAVAFRLAWERVRRRAGLEDLRFHDLRHEAISRFCEMGLTIPEVAVISGHRDPRMLFRYAHIRPDALARRLQGRLWSASDCIAPASPMNLSTGSCAQERTGD